MNRTSKKRQEVSSRHENFTVLRFRYEILKNKIPSKILFKLNRKIKMPQNKVSPPKHKIKKATKKPLKNSFVRKQCKKQDVYIF